MLDDILEWFKQKTDPRLNMSPLMSPWLRTPDRSQDNNFNPTYTDTPFHVDQGGYSNPLYHKQGIVEQHLDNGYARGQQRLNEVMSTMRLLKDKYNLSPGQSEGMLKMILERLNTPQQRDPNNRIRM